MRRISTALIAVGFLWLGAPGSIIANGPDPAGSWGKWSQEQRLVYGWLTGYVPPATTMQPPINRAAADSNSTNTSKAAAFAPGAGEGLIAYGASGTGWTCGPTGIACFWGGGSGGWFHINFRVHGTVLTNPDGSTFTVRWCDIDASNSSCWDVENVALDEMGHVLLLGHHSNPDYLDAIVQASSHTMGGVGWNVHNFAKCDVAQLQLKYDVTETQRISDCLLTDGNGLTTTLSAVAAPNPASEGDAVVFTGTLKIATSTSYELLSGQALSSRTTVSLYRAPVGSSTWTLIGTMTGSAGGLYRRTVTQSAVTYQWQARYVAATAEGLANSNSAALVVNVTPCSPAC